MYPTVLLIHSWLRWVVLLLALVAIVRAISGAVSGRTWTAADDLAGKLFLRSLDVQVLLGLLMYFVFSPITKAALGDFGGAMGNSSMRFWALEHWFGVVVGMVLAHRGRIRIQKIADPRHKHRVAAIFFTLALLAILASIPWPGTPNARPLFRW